MTGIGRTIKRTDLGNTPTPMALSTKATGSTTSNTEKVKNIGPTVPSMKVSTSTEKRMDMDSFCGLTGRAIAESL